MGAALVVSAQLLTVCSTWVRDSRTPSPQTIVSTRGKDGTVPEAGDDEVVADFAKYEFSGVRLFFLLQPPLQSHSLNPHSLTFPKLVLQLPRLLQQHGHPPRAADHVLQAHAPHVRPTG